MANSEPLVTVIMSSFNRPHLIRDALDSILAQTWMHWNIVVADDWSNEATCAVLAKYHRRLGDKLCIVKPPGNPPSVQERQFGSRCAIGINAAMKDARGEFVCFLPDDDFFIPQSIEVRARYLMEHPEVTVLYGRLEACKASIPVVGLHWMPDHDEDTCACKHDRDSFYSPMPIARAANHVDHGMIMVRCVPNLPQWPEMRTGARRIDLPLSGLGGRPNAKWAEVEDQDLADEWYDAPDAGWLFRLELAGLGPFHSVSEYCIVKRYHQHGHRSDPQVRE